MTGLVITKEMENFLLEVTPITTVRQKKTQYRDLF